jgi:hypothetical protein
MILSFLQQLATSVLFLAATRYTARNVLPLVADELVENFIFLLLLFQIKNILWRCA